MYCFPDFLVYCCLLLEGYFLGYYCKYAYVYGNKWNHWYALLAIMVSLAVASIWTYMKHKQRQYRFHHFYMIFYGLICYVISGCFLMSENLDFAFYFGFVAHATLFLPCYSYINLRSTSQGLRPACIAIGHMSYMIGLTVGFSIYNEFKAQQSAWIYLAITLTLIVATIINEILQHIGLHDYKKSHDVVFQLMNEEKIVFLQSKSIYALFVGRPDFYITKNKQLLVVGLMTLLVLERSFLYSDTMLNLSWSATVAYMGRQPLYGAFLFYSIGATIGAALMLRYKPRMTFLMFGLIKVTATAAILGVYGEFVVENCFLFLSFYYISLGVYSSVALQGILECSPFMFTELFLAGAYVLDLCMLELLKYESDVTDIWSILLGIGITTILLTLGSICVVLWLLPDSEGLIDVRNYLLGIRRHKPVVPQSKIWNANYFLHHDLQPTEVTCVTLDGNRVFQQYPREEDTKKTRF